MAEDKKDLIPFNDTWVLWYHNPSNNDWSTKSYHKVFEFSDLQSFWKLFNTWNDCLPSLDKSMFFLMKKREDGEYIFPMWEDTNNQKGGCFSFRVEKELIGDVWLKLCAYMISTTICNDTKDYITINGISSSPKRNFCILKIWNNDSNYATIDYLNSKLNEIIELHKNIYKSHLENISKDQRKKEKKDKNDKNTTFYKNNRRGNNRGRNNRGGNNRDGNNRDGNNRDGNNRGGNNRGRNDIGFRTTGFGTSNRSTVKRW